MSCRTASDRAAGAGSVRKTGLAQQWSTTSMFRLNGSPQCYRTLRIQASTGQDAMGAESPSTRHNFMLFVVFVVQTARGQNTGWSGIAVSLCVRWDQSGSLSYSVPGACDISSNNLSWWYTAELSSGHWSKNRAAEMRASSPGSILVRPPPYTWPSPRSSWAVTCPSSATTCPAYSGCCCKSCARPCQWHPLHTTADQHSTRDAESHRVATRGRSPQSRLAGAARVRQRTTRVGSAMSSRETAKLRPIWRLSLKPATRCHTASLQTRNALRVRTPDSHPPGTHQLGSAPQGHT